MEASIEAGERRRAPMVREGGCLCGAVRFVVTVEPITTVHCHCSDCRRATGAPFSTLAIYPRDAVRWTGAMPRRVPWAERLRLSCPHCGSPLGVLPAEAAAIVVLNVGCHDRPEQLAPACHVWTSDQLPYIRTCDDLPRHERMM